MGKVGMIRDGNGETVVLAKEGEQVYCRITVMRLHEAVKRWSHLHHC